MLFHTARVSTFIQFNFSTLSLGRDDFLYNQKNVFTIIAKFLVEERIQCKKVKNDIATNCIGVFTKSDFPNL